MLPDVLILTVIFQGLSTLQILLCLLVQYLVSTVMGALMMIWALVLQFLSEGTGAGLFTSAFRDLA